jgi:uncharacterized membrane protein
MEDSQIQQLRAQVEALSKRVNALEKLSGQEGKTTQQTASAAPNTAQIKKIAAPDFKAPHVNKAQGGMWLAGVGIFFFILAVSFFIKLAVESGWLTPARQLFGAVLFGFALVVSGFRLKGRDHQYAGFLPAAGIVVLFMAAYAGHLYWGLYTAQTSIFLIALVSFFTLYIFRQFEHDFFLVAAVCGSYFIPLFLGHADIDPFSLCLYFLFWDLLYCICAVLLGRRLLIGLTSYLALGVWFITFESSGSAVHFSWQYAIWFQTAQFLLFSSAVAFFSVKRKIELKAGEAWAFFPVLLLFYTIQYATLSDAVPETAAWVSLGFAAILFAIYRWAEQRLNKGSLESEPVVITFIGFTLFHAFYLELLPRDLCPWFGLLMIPFAGWFAKSRFPYNRFWPAYFLIYAVIFSEYSRTFFAAGTPTQENILLNLLFFAMLFFIYRAKKPAQTKDDWMLLLLLAVGQLLSGLERLADQYAKNFSLESAYLTSSLWAIAGFVMLLLARAWRDAMLARAAILVLGLVAGKVLFFDISASGSLARIIALVIIGGLMYAAGLVWRHIGEWGIESKK